MRKPRLSIPAIVSLAVGLGLTLTYVIIAIVIRASFLGVLTVAAVGIATLPIGLYVGSQFTKHVRGSNWRITIEHDDRNHSGEAADCHEDASDRQ
jgi:hypothetical protein